MPVTRRAGITLRVQALRAVRRHRSVILGYHGVARASRKDDLFMLQLPPERLRTQLRLFLEAGFRFVTVAQLARIANGVEPPPGLAAVTFDDGMRSVVTAALPIMRDLGIVGTSYISTDWLGRDNPWIAAGSDSRILTSEELKELAEAGWEIGAHTCSHADLSQLSYEDCLSELERNRSTLRELTGRPVETLAYPYGRYGDNALRAAQDLGFLAAVTTGSGTWRPLEMTRAMIGPIDPFPVVLLKVTDRYEPLLASAPLRVLRQQSKRLRQQWRARQSARREQDPH